MLSYKNIFFFFSLASGGNNWYQILGMGFMWVVIAFLGSSKKNMYKNKNPTHIFGSHIYIVLLNPDIRRAYVNINCCAWFKWILIFMNIIIKSINDCTLNNNKNK